MKNISYNTLKNKYDFISYQSFALYLIYIAVIAALCYRALFGVEITDEALYIAEGFLVTNGATPYVDMWLHCSGFALLNAPFIWLYTLIRGSTTGLVLYFRITSIFIKIVFVCLSIYILRPIIKPKITTLWLLPFVSFTPYSIVTLSYDTWASILLILSCIFLIRAILSETKNERIIFSYLAGSFSAISVLCYPTTIIVGSFLFFIIVGYEVFQYKKQNISIFFLSGALITAIIISIFFIIRTKNIFGILEGLQIIIYDNPYHKLSKNITKESLFLMLGYFKNWFFLFLFSWIFMNIPLINKKFKSKMLFLSIMLYILYQSYSIIDIYSQIIYTTAGKMQIFSLICRILFPIPLLLFILIEKDRILPKIMLFFLYLPALINTITASFLVFNGMNNRYYFLVQGTVLTIPFIYWAFIDIMENKKLGQAIAFLNSALCACIFAFIFLLNYYGYMYRDDPMPKLDYKVESGIYKGLYTTKQRGEGIESLEKSIKFITGANEKILFMDTVPMAYLMTDSKHCSPSSWELQQYTYGFKDDTLLRKYFEKTGCTPDKIIYIFTGRDKILSIDSEDYKFNNFVHAHYILTSEFEGYFPMKVYEKISNNTE